MPEFKWKSLHCGKLYFGTNNRAQNIENLQNKMERVRTEWAAGAQKQNTRIKTEGERWFSCAPAPESLLHQTFAQTEVLPLRHIPTTLQVPPERNVLHSTPLQCKFSVGFSESGVSVQHAGVGWGNLHFHPFWHVLMLMPVNKNIHLRFITPKIFHQQLNWKVTLENKNWDEIYKPALKYVV